MIFDLKPDDVYLVRGRRRLGDRPQLHRLRPPCERGDRRHLRGRPTRRLGSLVADRRGYGVTILYTAPTAIRAHMKQGPQFAEAADLSSLRVLGSVGES